MLTSRSPAEREKDTAMTAMIEVESLSKRYRRGDTFTREIIDRGKVLYEA